MEGPLETYFKNMIVFNRKRNARSFQEAGKHARDHIIKCTEGLEKAKGPAERLLAVMLCKIQSSCTIMSNIVALLPEYLQAFLPSALHRLLVDWVGKYFQTEFTRVTGTEVQRLLLKFKIDCEKKLLKKEAQLLVMKCQMNKSSLKCKTSGDTLQGEYCVNCKKKTAIAKKMVFILN